MHAYVGIHLNEIPPRVRKNNQRSDGGPEGAANGVSLRNECIPRTPTEKEGLYNRPNNGTTELFFAAWQPTFGSGGAAASSEPVFGERLRRILFRSPMWASESKTLVCFSDA